MRACMNVCMRVCIEIDTELAHFTDDGCSCKKEVGILLLLHGHALFCMILFCLCSLLVNDKGVDITSTIQQTCMELMISGELLIGQ